MILRVLWKSEFINVLLYLKCIYNIVKILIFTIKRINDNGVFHNMLQNICRNVLLVYPVFPILEKKTEVYLKFNRLNSMKILFEYI